MDKVLYLVRGLPGSGKSTLARLLTSYVAEADQYFTDIDGNYRFDRSKLALAHEACQLYVQLWMVQRVARIAVANTFTRHWEMAPYRDMASEFGYKVIEITLRPDELWPNVHNVPDSVIQSMRERWEE